EFLGTVVAAITGQLHAVSSSLWLFDNDAQTASLRLAYHDGRILSAAESGYPETTFSFTGWSDDPAWIGVLRERRPVVYSMATNRSLPPSLRDYLAAQGVKSSIVFPLALGDRVIGIFTVRF